MTTAAQVSRAYPKARDVSHALVALSGQLGIDPAWMANVIQFESRWNPQAVNRSTGASGLIQFMPSTAKGLGTTVEAIRRMTAGQQMQYVAAYFRRFRGKLRSQEDVFMAVFYPAAVGRGASYRFPARVTKVNPGIYTAGDYARKALRVAKLSPSPSPRSHPATTPSPGRRGGGDLVRRRRLIIGTSAAVFALIAITALVARRRMA
jgi:hypothetical protein